MQRYSSEILTSVILVTIVYGIFIFSAVLRIRSSWRIINDIKKSKSVKALKKLDLTFSSIFLLALSLFYLIFMLNFGK
jgi:hypothetical protein